MVRRGRGPAAHRRRRRGGGPLAARGDGGRRGVAATGVVRGARRRVVVGPSNAQQKAGRIPAPRRRGAAGRPPQFASSAYSPMREGIFIYARRREDDARPRAAAPGAGWGRHMCALPLTADCADTHTRKITDCTRPRGIFSGFSQRAMARCAPHTNPKQSRYINLYGNATSLARTSHSAQTACGLCFVVYTILYVPVLWYGTR